MIHTMTIKHKVTGYTTRQILQLIGEPNDKIDAFMNGELLDAKGNAIKTLRYPYPEIVGLEELSIHISKHWIKGQYGVSYDEGYIYLRIEPLTMITGEQHIRLFQCTDDNIGAFKEVFRREMAAFLCLDGTVNTLNELAELSTWDADRIDYTHDIRMRNHDEVLAMMNLCKMSAMARRYHHTGELSLYGDHFRDTTCKVWRNQWYVEVYDKQEQIRSKQKTYEDYGAMDIFERLLNESENILRIEYRRRNAGISTKATDFDDKNVMQFLSEQLADEWFYPCYAELFGYESFYVLDYQLDLVLAKAFPMSPTQQKREAVRKRKYDKELKAAQAEGRRLPAYKKAILGTKARKYREHMAAIAKHSGFQNALRHFDKTEETFDFWNNEIRNIAHISPVAIPKNWITARGRNMDLPHDFLPNPIKRPE